MPRSTCPRKRSSSPRSCWPPSGAAAARPGEPGADLLLAGSPGAALVPRPHLPDALARDHGISRATAPGVSRACLQTDLLAAGQRAARLHSRVRRLEKRLSETLGEQAWRESGLGTPADIDALNQKIIHLEQQAIDLRLQLEEQGEELAAARATNRELMTQLNHANRPR